MSHYTLLALVPNYLAGSQPPTDDGATAVMGYLEDLLAPFDENKEVEPYLRELSWFSGLTYLKDNGKLALEEHEPGFAEAYVEAYNSDPVHQSVFGTGPLVALDGKAHVWSTYNPKSKWDWWVVGGRWQGTMPNSSCQEPGRIMGEVGDNSMQVKDLLALLDSKGPGQEGPLVPFAVLTPGGLWHERGRMGWWAAVSDEKDQPDWLTEYRSVLEVHSDCLGVLLDLHI